MSKTIRANLKILVIGCSGVGKTCFVNRWTKDEYKDTHKPTIVSEFGFRVMEYKKRKYRIQLWDIGGQDKSPTMAQIFSRDAHGCLVLSDATKPETLQDTLSWKNVVNEESVFVDGGKLPFLLIQNKIDLITDKEKLKEVEEETKKVCEENDFTKYFLTSVKENINIEESMKFLLMNIVERMEIFSTNDVAKDRHIFIDPNKSTIQLRNNASYIKDKSSCC